VQAVAKNRWGSVCSAEVYLRLPSKEMPIPIEEKKITDVRDSLSTQLSEIVGRKSFTGGESRQNFNVSKILSLESEPHEAA
jgi:hypothetical protein